MALKLAEFLFVLGSGLIVNGCSLPWPIQHTVTGRITEQESGHPLENLVVEASYTAWGFSNRQLVWDKNYVTEGKTDVQGKYSLTYQGPGNVALMVRIRAAEPPLAMVYTGGRENVDVAVSLAPLPLPAVANRRASRPPGQSWPQYFCEQSLQSSTFVKVSWQGQPVEIGTSIYRIRGSGMMLPMKHAGEIAKEMELLDATNHRLAQNPQITQSAGCPEELVFLQFPDQPQKQQLGILLPSSKALLPVTVVDEE